MTITSSERVATLERSKPVCRGSSKALCIDRELWRVGAYPCSTCGIDRSDGPTNSTTAQAPANEPLEDGTSNILVRPSRARRCSA
ncbi:hypothetical protein RSAG8_07614, partial [Rhizoctonia solani AG-8 WAC10335]